MKIVFMGTPDFAVPCLERLIAGGHDLAGVFSQPDRPKGRGRQLSPTPVKQVAMEHGIPVFQPEKLRDGEAISKLKSLAPELIVVVAYGRILPIGILTLPPLGCVNIHASLLPELRGAAPIQWSVINGKTETGVTSMFMDEGLDTGDMILSEKTPIGPEETAGELFARLSAMGAELLARTISAIESGAAQRQRQDGSLATYAPMIDKSLAELDFSKTPKELCDLVRGMNPSPGAFTRLDGRIIKVLKARPVPDYTGRPGEVLVPSRLIVGCGDGAVELLSLKPEGKKPMSGEEFARGRRLAGGEMFTSGRGTT